MRIGYGYDSHRFGEGRRLVLGGVGVPGETGLVGHSDADVVIHAIIDALLGAAALGDAAGYKAELENSLKGWIHAGEMDYWRVKALRELGRDGECEPLVAELRQAIRELETPVPTVINAYAKFAGDNSAMERAAKAREKAGALRALLEELTAR